MRGSIGTLRACGLATILLAAASPALSAPERVVTLSPHLAELVCAAGGCDRLVGVVAWSDYPESVRGLARVGDAFAVSAERVVALQPDLVLAWEGGTPREIQARLRSLGLQVEAVSVRGLEEVSAAVRSIGDLLGTRAAAAAAAEAYARRLAQLRRRPHPADPLRVLYQIEAAPLYSVNRDSPISQAIELCGGVNVFADLPALAAPVEREAVLASRAEVVLYAKQDDTAAIRDYWRRLPEVPAARAGTFYEVDGNLLDRATPRMLGGIEQVCAALSDARAKLRATAAPRTPAPVPARAPSRKASPKAG